MESGIPANMAKVPCHWIFWWWRLVQTVSGCNTEGAWWLGWWAKKCEEVKECSFLLVECATVSHSRNLKSKILCNIWIQVSPNVFLNTSKDEGVIKSRGLEGVSQGVASVKRIKARRNNELVPTNILILTFNTPSLPQSAKAWIYLLCLIFRTPGDDLDMVKIPAVANCGQRHDTRTWNAQIERRNT